MQKAKVPTFDDYNKVITSLELPKVSKPIMTKYEFNQVISLRANQLALGATPFVDMSGIQIKTNMDLRKVAQKEMMEGRLPYILKRPLPNNKHEYYRIRDLDITAVQHMFDL